MKITKSLADVQKRVTALENKPVDVPLIQDETRGANRIQASFRVLTTPDQESLVIAVLQKTLAKVCDEFHIYKLEVDITRNNI